ncbi:response regulator transcription factor [Mariprofundus ferrooxydans]|uniref:response regulator transcription factor n=1 Tax=Mariprofundus ferrooxydans TaxID=314344 RepID=UPI00142FAE5D|nr:response regulator transcription factor [Mariprofundus ferrooxydans]
MRGTRLLLVDDDEIFCQVLAKALGRRGFDVLTAHSIEQALGQLDEIGVPDYAVVDLSMPGGGSGLVLVEQLHARSAKMRIVVLTGYASIATAVEAIKLGAIHYLSKPANADEIVQAFGKEQGDAETVMAERPSVRRLEWEHIQKVLTECEGNISAAARELGMHRRTLQRKLAKRPVKS